MVAKYGNFAMSWSSLLRIILLCFCLLVNIKISESSTFNVGDADGWDFDVKSWPNGKKFKAGDELVFKYAVGFHNVVVVDKNGYDNCTAPAGAKKLTSGNDTIKLVKGDNFFICSVPTHCDGFGMKIAVTAT